MTPNSKTGYFIYYPIIIQLLSIFTAVLSHYQIETVNIACVCQFSSDESSYWLILAQYEEANNMSTHDILSWTYQQLTTLQSTQIHVCTMS